MLTHVCTTSEHNDGNSDCSAVNFLVHQQRVLGFSQFNSSAAVNHPIHCRLWNDCELNSSCAYAIDTVKNTFSMGWRINHDARLLLARSRRWGIDQSSLYFFQLLYRLTPMLLQRQLIGQWLHHRPHQQAIQQATDMRRIDYVTITPWHVHAPRTIPSKKHHRLARLQRVENAHFLQERTLDS